MERSETLCVADTAAAEDVARLRDPRESMLLMASMRGAGEDGGPLPLKVRNLSAGGLMAESERAFTAGERVEVDLRNVGTVLATIAWARGGRIGVRFDRRIDPKAVRKPVPMPGIQTSKMIVGLDSRRPGLRF